MATVMSFAQAATDVIAPPQEFDPSSWNWVNILICVLILLIVLVIARAFDIGGLAERITGRKIVSSHKVNGIIALVVLILGLAGVFWEISAHSKYLLLWDAASEHGESLDSMFMWTFGFTFFVFIVTEVLLFFFMFKYYYREDRKAAYFFHNNKLEVIWTIVPAIVLTFWYCVVSMYGQKSPKPPTRMLKKLRYLPISLVGRLVMPVRTRKWVKAVMY